MNPHGLGRILLASRGARSQYLRRFPPARPSPARWRAKAHRLQLNNEFSQRIAAALNAREGAVWRSSDSVRNRWLRLEIGRKKAAAVASGEDGYKLKVSSARG